MFPGLKDLYPVIFPGKLTQLNKLDTPFFSQGRFSISVLLELGELLPPGDDRNDQ